jgi:hypothetical protein
MPVTKHKVVIVVERAFGSRLAALASDRHVWIVESPVNTPAMRQVWDAPASGDEDDPLGPGVTSFAATDAETPEAMCARIADDVAEHHSDASHGQPWAEIEVIGVPLSPLLRQVFENIGGTVFQQTADGFVCRR